VRCTGVGDEFMLASRAGEGVVEGGNHGGRDARVTASPQGEDGCGQLLLIPVSGSRCRAALCSAAVVARR
jgi:hypothetical protein